MSFPEIMRDSIYGTCIFEVANSKFTDEQKAELTAILEEYKKINPTNIFKIIKIRKLLNKFDELYIKYGGDGKALEQKIVKNSGIVEMAKNIPGVEKHIIEDDVHKDNERS